MICPAIPFPIVLTLAGLVAVLCAVTGPLAAVAHHSFAAHMAQQMILMDIAAPFFVWAIGAGKIRACPGSAALVHAVVMWGWHLPAMFALMMTTPAAHVAMQISFFAAGLMFWSGVLKSEGDHPGSGLFWLFMTVMHSGLLGALLTFAPTALYGVPLADQHLGGLIMWVLGTGVYAVAGAIVAARWLGALERTP